MLIGEQRKLRNNNNNKNTFLNTGTEFLSLTAPDVVKMSHPVQPDENSPKRRYFLFQLRGRVRNSRRLHCHRQWNLPGSRLVSETEMSSCWLNFRHWLHRKLSLWRIPHTDKTGPISWITTQRICLVTTVKQSTHILAKGRQPFDWLLWTGSSSHSQNVLTHWGRDKMDAISQTTFSSAFSWMRMSEFR